MYKFIVTFLLGVTTLLFGQYNETEPNNTRSQANAVTSGNPAIVSATLNPGSDLDFFSVNWQKDCMYYVTSVENATGVAPDVQVFSENGLVNLLTVSVAGRNSNNNFRLSGYVPKFTGRYDVRINNAGAATGAYKVRFAGGRGLPQLLAHEPDHSQVAAAGVSALAQADTVYGAVYPANDIDYYKLSGVKDKQYVIGTTPILDLDVRDFDSYITLYDSDGKEIAKNDDLGNVTTPSGSTNCTFSRVTGVFPKTGDYYLAVRSFYNGNFGETINESNPPTGEYGVYYLASDPAPVTVLARYPHLEMPTTTSALIQWNTTSQKPTVLFWGPTTACDHKITQTDSVHNHQVFLSGLTPESKYYYRALLDTDTTGVEHFYTAKPSSTKEVKFFVIGDSSPYTGFGSSPEQLLVAAQIQKKEFDFGLHVGDINQHIGEEYDLVYYQAYVDILKHATIFTCIGNHDTYFDGTLTYQNSFELFHNNPDSTERYYSANFGNVHIISLDTNLPYDPSSPQYQWLVNDLTSSMRKATLWTFVINHQPPYSEGWPGYPGEIGVRTYLIPLYEKYGVDMSFSGHTHNYERGCLNGVYYIITGGGGAPLEDGTQPYTYDHVAKRINEHHFTYIQIDGNLCILQAINLNGQLIDEVFISKKTSAVPEVSEETKLVETFQLHPNYPNPFNSSTQISFAVKYRTSVSLTVHDLTGRLVRTLANGEVQAGVHQVRWNGVNETGQTAASGVYLIKFSTPDYTQVQRAVLLK